ncbi:putative STE20-related kinase adapter protein alpha-like [Capsicum annuum]|uniref:Protein kinase domain-containing protein n=1 Tax=Capsicum annuum TaxID=4072 RepID=A0A2G2YJV2_CAPAN|nr:putative STE20-related kinase adapter protein alpha-like [Capsicum annuum]KAF3676909.1 putative STE20-related kinase adapter protein alpha-like [Capsicum annuum]PHT69995.1 hypothetical protein T459_25099 [Capsicum annuum]
MDIAISQAKFDEKTIFDKYTKDTYFLEKEIGTLYNGRCRVYKALYSQYDQENDISFLDEKSIYRWGAAPEVFGSENENSSGPKSDIWLLGITALELAYGNLAVRNRGELNYIIKNIREKKKFPESLERLLIKRGGEFKKAMKFLKQKKRVFSVEFEEMVLACLSENPVKRPTAGQLLNTPFFTTAIEKFKQFVLNGDCCFTYSEQIGLKYCSLSSLVYVVVLWAVDPFLEIRQGKQISSYNTPFDRKPYCEHLALWSGYVHFS